MRGEKGEKTGCRRRRVHPTHLQISTLGCVHGRCMQQSEAQRPISSHLRVQRAAHGLRVACQLVHPQVCSILELRGGAQGGRRGGEGGQACALARAGTPGMPGLVGQHCCDSMSFDAQQKALTRSCHAALMAARVAGSVVASSRAITRRISAISCSSLHRERIITCCGFLCLRIGGQCKACGVHPSACSSAVGVAGSRACTRIWVAGTAQAANFCTSPLLALPHPSSHTHTQQNKNCGSPPATALPHPSIIICMLVLAESLHATKKVQTRVAEERRGGGQAGEAAHQLPS